MPERPFQCTPTAWNRDAALNSVSWEADYMFRRLSLESDRYWRVQVDPNNIPQSIRCRAFEPERRFVAWPLPKIARYLNELLAAGIVRKLQQGERCWIEVADFLQYEKGRDPNAGPETTKQADMPLGGELFALPPPAIPSPKKRTTSRAQPRIPMRTESEESKADESPARKAARSVNNSTAADRDGTQAQSRRGGDSDRRFARDESAFPGDELWADLCRTLGAIDMYHNGAMWESRFRENRQAVCHALMDYLTKAPDERARIPAAPYITAAYRNEVRRAS